MVLAGDTLFIAGPPDLVDEEQAVRKLTEAEAQARLAEQAASQNGRKGALLRAISAKDGSSLAEYKLDVPPVFDGMIAAYGRLIWATVDGHVVCWN